MHDAYVEPLWGISVYCALDDVGAASLDGLLRRFSTYRVVHLPRAGQLRRATFQLLPSFGRQPSRAARAWWRRSWGKSSGMWVILRRVCTVPGLKVYKLSRKLVRVEGELANITLGWDQERYRGLRHDLFAVLDRAERWPTTFYLTCTMQKPGS